MSVFTQEQKRLITANIDCHSVMFDADKESVLEYAFSDVFFHLINGVITTSVLLKDYNFITDDMLSFVNDRLDKIGF